MTAHEAATTKMYELVKLQPLDRPPTYTALNVEFCDNHGQVVVTVKNRDANKSWPLQVET